MDKSIFRELQAKIDHETSLRDELSSRVETIDQESKVLRLLLGEFEISNNETSIDITKSIEVIKVKIQELAKVASEHSYYKYVNVWDRAIQEVACLTLLAAWRGALQGHEDKKYQLLTLEQVGQILNATLVPVYPEEVKFHISIEEYLHGVLSISTELARLSVNAVIYGNKEVPLKSLQTIENVHSSFQLLSLKNDSLRRHFDGLKYQLKRAEDVVYDMRIHNLLNE
ncbi:translin [Schizosaccharomyces octosporus yFS286]|uniref:Translin n=1 Tax=Schizosaccharomyces octosporus (strain yFS286) TaxID=483514 RepID=S9R9G0_SCHOY|nr:translin [Schizosaccharomyces octosporus yFS286]EPX70774.1 translin [Schizosaccharomyces octosporus yFS286]